MSEQAIRHAAGALAPRKQDLARRLAAYGQEHLLQFWDELSAAQRLRLAEQIEAVDFELLEYLLEQGDQTPAGADFASRAEPPPAVRLAQPDAPIGREQARRRGEAALRAGEVGMLLVAGGQGTRLGAACPKGMLPVGPISGRSLYQILIDRLLAVRARFGARIPLYLMTSPATHAETIAYLEEQQRFGLPAEDLFVFCQGVMPALCAASGRLLLSAPDALCLSPDGHGGMLPAFDASGGLDDARRRGIEQLYYCQVDNPLGPVCDPELLGYHLLAGSEMTTLAVAKAGPQERVGNLVLVDGKVQIIEYSELPAEIAAQRNADGSLRLWAGNIAIHVFDARFLKRAAATPEALPHHRAHRATPYLAADGRLVAPTAPNAIKLERFIFDLLPLARQALVVEADRSAAFAPVKNARGESTDTVETAQAAMLALSRRWLRAAGIHVPEHLAVEIHPQFALDADELAARLPRETILTEPSYFAAAAPEPAERGHGGSPPVTGQPPAEKSRLAS